MSDDMKACAPDVKKQGEIILDELDSINSQIYEISTRIKARERYLVGLPADCADAKCSEAPQPESIVEKVHVILDYIKSNMADCRMSLDEIEKF